MYEEFAQVYDQLMKEIDYGEWAGYLQEIFLNDKRKINKIIELGCGTGNITHLLAQKGFNLVAVDLSESMLAVADEKANAAGIKNIRFYRGDMSDFQSNETFDAVISCCDSVNYLPDIETMGAFFKRSYECLEDGGRLLFDMNTILKYKKTIADHTFVYDVDDIFCVWENEPDFEKNAMHFNLTFFIEEANGRYRRHEEVQTQYFYALEEIRETLQNVGFKAIRFYDFGTFLEGDEHAERIQVVAKKIK